MTPAASYAARQSDVIFFGMVFVCLVLLVGITAAMVYFVVRYRKSRNPEAADIRNNTALEIAWTVIPTVLVLGMFYTGLVGFESLRGAPANAMEVTVTGRMWQWSYTYDNGLVSDVLGLPRNTPVRLLLRSDDVLHSFFIPAFRIKEDAVPGMETHVWFQPERAGTYDVFCAEYCGLGHSRMLSRIVVMEQEAYEHWMAERSAGQVDAGAALFQSKGCSGCHSLDGTPIVGPTLKDLFGRREIVVTGGKEREIVADREYVRRSLLEPGADIVKGYPPVMPAQGATLTKEELEKLLDFLEGRAREIPEGVHGEEGPHHERDHGDRGGEAGGLLAAKGCTACHSLDGTRIAGPTFKGIFGRRERVITDGQTREVLVDEDYLRRSMLEPQADIVEGYPPIMPSQKGSLSEEDIRAIIEELRGLGGEASSR